MNCRICGKEFLGLTGGSPVCNDCETGLKQREYTPKKYSIDRYGWICPKCGRANAPQVLSCACYAEKQGCKA